MFFIFFYSRKIKIHFSEWINWLAKLFIFSEKFIKNTWRENHGNYREKIFEKKWKYSFWFRISEWLKKKVFLEEFFWKSFLKIFFEFFVKIFLWFSQFSRRKKISFQKFPRMNFKFFHKDFTELISQNWRENLFLVRKNFFE